jgi:hypothetical protein
LFQEDFDTAPVQTAIALTGEYTEARQTEMVERGEA